MSPAFLLGSNNQNDSLSNPIVEYSYYVLYGTFWGFTIHSSSRKSPSVCFFEPALSHGWMNPAFPQTVRCHGIAPYPKLSLGILLLSIACHTLAKKQNQFGCLLQTKKDNPAKRKSSVSQRGAAPRRWPSPFLSPRTKQRVREILTLSG